MQSLLMLLIIRKKLRKVKIFRDIGGKKMWIRSQDKELLVNANEFSIEELYEYGELIGYSIDYNDYELGLYQTKENAMKVLSMLEAHIVFFKLATINHYTITIKDVVFEMPQDWSDEE